MGNPKDNATVPPYSGPQQTTVAAAEEENLLFTPDDFKYDQMVSSCDLSIRYAFVRKVYTLLGLQLFFTFIAQVLFFYDIIPRYIIFKPIFQIPAFVGSFVLCIVLFMATTNDDDYAGDEETGESRRPFFAPVIRMQYKTQLFLLGLFTVCESVMISYITVLYNPRIIMSAVLCTLVIVASTTLFVFRQAKKYEKNNGSLEFEEAENRSLFKIYNVLWILTTFLLGFGVIMIFMAYNSTRELIFSWIGAILFTLYLYVDSYMVLRKVRPNEEIRCCMMLYLDIINLFLNILRILAHNNNDD